MMRLLFFIALIPLSHASSHWLWLLICKSADTTAQKIREVRIRAHSRLKPHRYAVGWLVDHSPEPGKTKALLFWQYLLIIPPRFGAFFAFVGSLYPSWDRPLTYAGAALSLLIVGTTTVGILYDLYTMLVKKDYSRSLQKSGYSPEDVLFYKVTQGNSYDSHDSRTRVKALLICFFKLLVALSLMVLIVLFSSYFLLK